MIDGRQLTMVIHSDGELYILQYFLTALKPLKQLMT